MSGYIGIGGKAKKIKGIYLGVGGVAKSVKKAYVGIGGKAKLWYVSGPPISYNSTISKGVSANRYSYTGRVGNYLYVGSRTSNSRYAYDTSLTKKTWETTDSVYGIVTMSSYILVGVRSSPNSLDAYNSSLTKSTVNLGPGIYISTIGSNMTYALLRKATTSGYFITVNNSLSVNTNNISIGVNPVSGYGMSSCYLNGRAIFGGGASSSDGETTIDNVLTVDTSLAVTQLSVILGSIDYENMCSASSKYAMFLCGGNPATVYNTSFTRSSVSSPENQAWNGNSTVVGGGEYLLIYPWLTAGTSAYDTWGRTIGYVDSKLTKVQLDNMSGVRRNSDMWGGCNRNGGAIANYIILTGGYTTSSSTANSSDYIYQINY